MSDYPQKGRYRHFKGGEYELLYIARHSETDEPMVVYRALYECSQTPLGERIWVRPLSMWQDIVTRDGETYARFTYIGSASDNGANGYGDANGDGGADVYGGADGVGDANGVDGANDIGDANGDGGADVYGGADGVGGADVYGGANEVGCANGVGGSERSRNNAPVRDALGARMLGVLKDVFGYDEFRGGQEEAIRHIIAGRDTLGVMPTGSGKSLCYQIPALMLNGCALIISPLISLMKDQVNALTQSGVAAAFINSSLTERQSQLAMRNALDGKYKIIYVAPERLLTDRFMNLAARLNISLIAVDEAHCISQWGQDFRPSYLDIPRFINALGARPKLCAFTATATVKVRADIKKLLELKAPAELVTGFDRPNLYFRVERPSDKREVLADFMRAYEGMSGIVYCATRKTVEETAKYLKSLGVSATRYHAGLSDDERKQNQDAFTNDDIRVMVATNAFGMGIDKSDVRFVIHYNMPKDIESYYQEAGRAGRDGERAECVMLFSHQDVVTQNFFIDRMGEEAGLSGEEAEKLKTLARARLSAIKNYCVTDTCLRAHILRYFGETGGEACGRCHNCARPDANVDVTPIALNILGCVREMGQRYGAALVGRVLMGSKDARILQYNLNKLNCYGALSQYDRRGIAEIIDRMLDKQILTADAGEYPILRLGPGARAVFAGEARVMARAMPEGKGARVKKAKGAKAAPVSEHAELFERLRALRAACAQEKNVPAFVIFSDATLRDMTRKLPATPEDMLNVSGVGAAKLRVFGEAFLAEIRAWKNSN